MRARSDSDAVAQTVAFIVASAVFLGVFGAILVATSDGPREDGGRVQDSANRVEAERLADVLVASQGIGWASGADGLDRLGLQHDDGARLDTTRLDALRGAAHAVDGANGKVDYEEALAGLGLPNDGTVGFHVRIAPVGIQNQLQAADLSHIRTAYVGDWLSLDTSLEVDLAADLSMVADARAQAEVDIGLLPPNERQVLVDLGLGFDNSVHLLDGIDVEVDLSPLPDVDLDALVPDSLLEGDVYPDNKQYLNTVLADRLPEYDLLVIGSTVAHNTLTSNAVKDAVRDWVMAGGTLFVFGSESNNFQWLQPLFHVGTSTVNSAPAAPDVSHPLLHEPHELDWTSYDHHGLGWDLPSQGANAVYDEFQHIITTDGDDVLTVSNEGTFGTGRVFLTTYRPSEVSSLLSHDEATNLVHNMVLFSDRSHLYLDYGPTPPDGAAVSAAVRTTQVEDADLGMVNVRVTVLYWGV